MINDCDECSYDDYSFNKFHCSKCTQGQQLNETHECSEISGEVESDNIDTTNEDLTETDDFEIYKNYSGEFVNSYFSLSLILLLIIFI